MESITEPIKEYTSPKEHNLKDSPNFTPMKVPSFDEDNIPEIELLRKELEKERQSKMALENMIIVSSLNMIGKIEVLEKKHESQIEQLREQLLQYAEKEQDNNMVTRNLEDANMRLRNQIADLQKKMGRDGKEKDGKEGKDVKEGKRKRQNNSVDHLIFPEKKSKSQTKSSTSSSSSSSSSIYAADSDPLREIVAEALGTFGDIEKRPRQHLQHSIDGNMSNLNNNNINNNRRMNKSYSGGDWDHPPSPPTSIPDTPPAHIKRKKGDIASSQDGSGTPPLPFSHSPAISDSYTSNYSTFFQYGASSSSSPYPPSPSSAPASPTTPLSSSASSLHTSSSSHMLNSSLNGTHHLSSSQSSNYSLSSSQNGNRSPDPDYDPHSPSKHVQLVPLFPPASILLPNSPHEKLLADVHQLQIAQKDRLEKMQQSQKQLILERKHDPLLVGALESEQLQLRQQMDAEIKAIKQLDKQVILEPNQLFRLDFLLQDLKIQQKQLELFHNELQLFLAAPDPSRCHAALVITKQPFPMVISKFKQLQEEQLVVQLLSGSNVDFHSFSVVKAELICHTKAITKGSTSASNPNASLKKHVDRDTQPLDLSKGVAKFPLKFLTGTRKSCVTLRFVVQVKTASNTVSTVESNASQPFIVITNDCQWEGSEGTLLKNEAFSDQIEIPWPQFVNILQRHFLKATRQSPIQPTRPLSLFDFNYLNSKFFGNKPIVSHKSFDNFWSWFGKSLQTVRYKRHISTLWQNGLIFMFLTRERVSQILRNQDAGCFIILFSEAYPGQLEISYVASDKLNTSQTSMNLSTSSQGLGAQGNLSVSGQNINLSTSSQNVPTSSPGTPLNVSYDPNNSDVSHQQPNNSQTNNHTPLDPTPPVHINPLAASYDGINTGSNASGDSNPSAPSSPSASNANSNANANSHANSNGTSNALNTSSGNINLNTSASGIPTGNSNSSIATPSTPTTPSSSSSSISLLGPGSFTSPSTQLTAGGNKIKHYLVQANDTAGSKRTLPDFLNECPQFTHILQLNVTSLNTSTDWTTVGIPSFKKQPKDQVLEPFYSKRGATSPGFIANGYDPL